MKKELEKELPMRWYWFYSHVWLTIRVMLLFCGILVDVDAVVTVSNSYGSGGDIAAVSGVFSLVLDVIMTIIAFITADSLQSKLTSAVKDNLRFMIADIAFLIVKCLLKNQDNLNAAIFVPLLSGLAVLNHIYFKKRSHLFENTEVSH